MLNIYEQEINSIEIPFDGEKNEKLLNQKAKKHETIFGASNQMWTGRYAMCPDY